MTDIARQAGAGESATKEDVWPLTAQEARIIRRWWIRLTQTQPPQRATFGDASPSSFSAKVAQSFHSSRL